jgi:Na+-translocating ferredoxin:NAD+ oxidoreductase subunit B
MPENEKKGISRRDLVRRAGLGAAIGAAALATGCAGKVSARRTVWQLDPAKCIQCGKCATECVLDPSAVKCVQAYSICGYCDLCFGYMPPGIEPEMGIETPGAEAQLCPTGAINRKWVEGPHFEYSIDEELCIGCAKCVKGCNLFGNGSFFLQTRHNRCLNCNECKIAAACPSKAWSRVSADKPYMLKDEESLR